MRVLGRYLCVQTMIGSVIVFGGLLGLFILFELIHQLSGLGATRSIWNALLLTMLEIPIDTLEVLPIAITGGCALALGALATQSEIIVMLSLAYPRAVLIRYILLTTGLIYFFVAMILHNVLTPLAASHAQVFDTPSKFGLESIKSNLWLREGNKIISAAYVLNQNYYDVSIYEYNADQTRLETITKAESMTVAKGQMNLSGVSIAHFENDQMSLTHVQNKLVKRSDTASDLNLQTPDPETLNSWRLYTQINTLQANRLNSRFHELEFWQRLTEPLSVFVLLFITLPFCFVFRRGRSAWLYMLIGLGIGLAYLLTNRIVSAWMLLHYYPPFLAAFTTLLVFLVLGFANYYRYGRQL